MSLAAGTRLGPYEILAPIGAGGMGEVYRARDLKLGREVAIKVLPQEFAREKERLERFEREARLLAQINHPNIATLHGVDEHDGLQFLVMELVDGETLAERIAHGAIPVVDAAPLFTQIAAGLEAAHEKGIVHRDLKPANIKIDSENRPKILDFGLSKVFLENPPGEPDSSRSPTLTRGTALGAVVGTASYMSPEQARGKPVDKRTDTWAFGCCLYEALAGKKAFRGETPTDTISAIVRAEPEWHRLPRSTPPAIRKLLRRCLTKERKDRLADMTDARLELQDDWTEPVHVSESSRRRRVTRYAPIAAVAVAGVLVGAILSSLNLPTPGPTMRLSITLPEGQKLVNRFTSPIALSPDGRRLVYAA